VNLRLRLITRARAALEFFSVGIAEFEIDVLAASRDAQSPAHNL